MFASFASAGLRLPTSPVPDPACGATVQLTDEAAITPSTGEELRVEALVAEEALVAQGQPLLRLRGDPRIALVAPMAGRVAAIEMQPGRRLTQLVLFREGAERHRYAPGAQDAASLRDLMQASGLWRALWRRPFGGMPHGDERPAAIFVMAADSRPDAANPWQAVQERHADLDRGLSALAKLGADAVYLVTGPASDLPLPDGVRRIRCAALHPQGLAGIRIHHHHPARPDAPVWDIAVEDVADLGTLLATGMLSETRLVSITGAALNGSRLRRTQPGADLRGLCHDILRPGPHRVLSGSALDGRPAHWLGPRDRQVTALPDTGGPAQRHWFGIALRRAARPLPIIATQALDQAMGGDIPAAALTRALGAGDPEAAIRLGALSLLEEDLALADYVTGASPRLAAQLRVLLDRIRLEEGLP